MNLCLGRGLLLVAFVSCLVACGGGGGGSSTTFPAAGQSTPTPRLGASPTPTGTATPTTSPTSTPSPVSSAIVFDENPALVPGVTVCPTSLPVNTTCFPVGSEDTYESSNYSWPDGLSEVGGPHAPFTVTSSNGAIAAGGIFGSGYYYAGFGVKAFAPGTAMLHVVSANGDTADLAVTVTTLEVTVNYNNLPNAYHTEAYATYGGSPTCSQTDDFVNGPLPSPMPNSYSVTSQNVRSYTVPCPVTGVGVTVTDGVKTIATDYQNISLVSGGANFATLNPH